MALLPYILIEKAEAQSPLIIDSPHSGRIYPVDFAYACPLPLLRQAEDAYVDDVILGAVDSEATILLAEFPRSMIDVNRAESDIDPATIDGIWPEPLSPDSMTLSGFGLVRRLCRNGVPIYRSPLSVAEIRRRIDIYYRPYHNCLEKLITARLRKFGSCYLLNAHSMPHRIDNGVERPDFVLGDLDEVSCSPQLTLFAQQILQEMGYRVTINDPYKGREIVKRYGLNGQGAHALQIEINRSLYLDEIAIQKHDGYVILRRNLSRFFQAISAYIKSASVDRFAAE